MSNAEITNLLTKNISIFDTVYREWKLYIIDNQLVELKIEPKIVALNKYRFPYQLIQKIGQSGLNDETFLNTLQRLKFDENFDTNQNSIVVPSYCLPILGTIRDEK